MSEGMRGERFLRIPDKGCIIGKKKGGTGMGMEYERKFRAEEAVQQQLLVCLAGERAEYRMKTVYYDTPSMAIGSRKWTLRCRMENGVAVCTLKTPGEGNIRGEWETEEGEITQAIDKLCKHGAPEELALLCREGLQPVCGAEFTRTAITLTHGTSTLEVAVDRGILTGGSRTAPICEVEVELKTGSISDADAFAGQLAQQFSLTEEPLSKVQRALALVKGENYV